MTSQIPFTIFLVPLIFLVTGAATHGDPPVLNNAPPLPEAAGEVIDVSSVEELYRALDEVPAGGTVRLAGGHYLLPSVLTIATDGVTLRSRSGERTQVILDGKRSRHGELVLIRGHDVTVADLSHGTGDCIASSECRQSPGGKLFHPSSPQISHQGDRDDQQMDLLRPGRNDRTDRLPVRVGVLLREGGRASREAIADGPRRSG